VRTLRAWRTNCSGATPKSGGLRTFDALIAATAIEDGFMLVSKNRKHFQMIGGLNLIVPDY